MMTQLCVLRWHFSSHCLDTKLYFDLGFYMALRSLENCCAARYRGFESYFLRHILPDQVACYANITCHLRNNQMFVFDSKCP